MYRQQNFLLFHWPSDPGTNENRFDSLTINPLYSTVQPRVIGPWAPQSGASSSRKWGEKCAKNLPPRQKKKRKKKHKVLRELTPAPPHRSDHSSSYCICWKSGCLLNTKTCCLSLTFLTYRLPFNVCSLSITLVSPRSNSSPDVCYS